MRKVSGLALVAIGLLHSLLALVMPGAIGFTGIWKEISDVGVFDAVKPESPRNLGLLLAPGARIPHYHLRSSLSLD